LQQLRPIRILFVIRHETPARKHLPQASAHLQK
jgi:hypothetical protein